MKLTTGQKLQGFTVVRVRECARVGGTFYEMIHDRTGAELCYAANAEENKLFSVAFKTLPEDSTGVFHILEHSVLSGSRKYPVKEPFLDLIKGSMNTFLNAMTFPDKTVYPVSSKNEQDFLNLTGVYLDAVFAPRLTETDMIFRQEGWRIEVNEDGPAYNGVVFNEMKGALSDVNDRLMEETEAMLFPDNCYAFNSGGDPACIPGLTYEAYVDFYRRYYHPSNARIYLDGDLPLEKTLALIDGYLSGFDKLDFHAEIVRQRPVGGEKTVYYEADGRPGDRDQLVFAKILCDYDDIDRQMAAGLLTGVLAGTNEAPLKRAILSAGLAEDVDFMVHDGILQPAISLSLRNMKDANTAEIRRVIRETVEKTVREGIPKEELTAALNKAKFAYLLKPEPQGLYRNFDMLASWLYGGDPLLTIDLGDAFDRMERMIEDGGFEKLTEDLFLNGEGLCVLHMLPSDTLAAETAEAEAKRVKAVWDGMTAAEQETLRRSNEALTRWQTDPDSPEAKATLPVLPLSAVSELPETVPTGESEAAGVKVLYHPAATSGIRFVSLYFPMTSCSLEELKLVGFLEDLYGQLPTADHDALSLQREMKSYIGSFSVSVGGYARTGDFGHCVPTLRVTAGYLPENTEKALSLVREVLLTTDFSAKEKIREIVLQVNEGCRQRCIAAGNAVGISAVRSFASSLDAAMEAIHGISSVVRVRSLAERFDEEWEGFRALLERVSGAVIGRRRLLASVTCSEPVDLTGFLSSLPEGAEQPAEAVYASDLPRRLGVQIPAPVAYAVKGYHAGVSDDPDQAVLQLLGNVVTYSYLWGRIRIQGGAYGTGMRPFSGTGVSMMSYRDPSPAASLAAYDAAADFLTAYVDGDEELDKYILSTIAGLEPLATPLQKGLAADQVYLGGASYELRCARRRALLHADKPSLLRWRPLLTDLAEKGAVCVVAGEDALKTVPDLTVIRL